MRTFYIIILLFVGIIDALCQTGLPLPNAGRKRFSTVQLYSDNDGRSFRQDDISAVCKMNWDKSGLNAMIHVMDDTISNADNVEIFIASNPGGKDLIQWIIQLNTVSGIPNVVTWDHRGTRKIIESGSPNIKVKYIATKVGYDLNLQIALEQIGLKSIEGTGLGLQIYVNDIESNGKGRRSLKWHYMNNTYINSRAMYQIKLTKDNAFNSAVNIKSFVEDEKYLFFKIIAPASYAAKKIEVKSKDTVSYRGMLKAEGEWAQLEIQVPLNAKTSLPQKVYINDTLVETVNISEVNRKYTSTESKAFSDEIRGFKLRDKITTHPKAPILFLGHSLFRYWKTLETDMPELSVLNRGFGGSRVENLIYYYNDVVVPYKPSMVVLAIGANDVNIGQSPESVFIKFQVFTNRIHAQYPSIKVIVLSHFYYYYPRFKNLKTYDDLVMSYVKNTKWMVLCDIRNAIDTTESGYLKRYFSPDKIHLNPEGYKKLAPYVKAQIAKAQK